MIALMLALAVSAAGSNALSAAGSNALSAAGPGTPVDAGARVDAGVRDRWDGGCQGSVVCLDDGGVRRLVIRTEDASLKAAPTLTLAAAGDVTLGYHFEQYFDLRLDGGTWADAGPSPAQTREQLLDYPFAKVKKVLARADIAVANLECPFTDRGEKIAKNFNFRASPGLAAALPPSGVDVVTLANNHLMDYGPDGVRDTLAALNAQHIAHFGAGMNLAQARKPAIVKRHGEKVAFLGYLYIGNPPIEPLVVWAQKNKPGVAGAGGDLQALLAMVKEDVAAAKKKAQVVVVFFHFGREAHHEI